MRWNWKSWRPELTASLKPSAMSCSPWANSAGISIGKAMGMPGWITLWRGWLQLQALVEGFLLAHKRKNFG